MDSESEDKSSYNYAEDADLRPEDLSGDENGEQSVFADNKGAAAKSSTLSFTRFLTHLSDRLQNCHRLSYLVNTICGQSNGLHSGDHSLCVRTASEPAWFSPVAEVEESFPP